MRGGEPLLILRHSHVLPRQQRVASCNPFGDIRVISQDASCRGGDAVVLWGKSCGIQHNTQLRTDCEKSAKRPRIAMAARRTATSSSGSNAFIATEYTNPAGSRLRQAERDLQRFHSDSRTQASESLLEALRDVYYLRANIPSMQAASEREAARARIHALHRVIARREAVLWPLYQTSATICKATRAIDVYYYPLGTSPPVGMDYNHKVAMDARQLHATLRGRSVYHNAFSVGPIVHLPWSEDDGRYVGYQIRNVYKQDLHTGKWLSDSRFHC